MNMDLDTLLPDIYDSLKDQGLAIFHCEMRAADSPSAVYWDVEQHPSHDGFLDVATACGVKIITLFSKRFDQAQIQDALAQIEEAEVEGDERRALQTELRSLQQYQGHVCHIEISFSHGFREYIYEARTPWFEDYNHLLDQIERSYMVPDDDSPLDGGYYSKN